MTYMWAIHAAVDGKWVREIGFCSSHYKAFIAGVSKLSKYANVKCYETDYNQAERSCLAGNDTTLLGPTDDGAKWRCDVMGV